MELGTLGEGLAPSLARVDEGSVVPVLVVPVLVVPVAALSGLVVLPALGAGALPVAAAGDSPWPSRASGAASPGSGLAESTIPSGAPPASSGLRTGSAEHPTMAARANKLQSCRCIILSHQQGSCRAAR